MLNDQNLWCLYAKGVAQAAGLPSLPDNFVLAGTALPASFAVGSTGLGTAAPTEEQAHAALYMLADGEAHCGGVYDPSGGSFFSVYANYIDNLVPNGGTGLTPVQAAAVALAQKNITAAQATHDADQAKAFTAYSQAQTMFPGKYADFQAFLNQTSWGNTLSSDSAALKAANSKLRAQLSGIYGQSYVAIQTAQSVVDQVRGDLVATNVNTPAEMKVSFDSGDQIVPAYNSTPAYSAIANWVDGVIAAVGPNGVPANPKSVTISATSNADSFSATSFAAQTSWSVHRFFWTVHAGAAVARQAMSVDTSHSAFSLTIAFADVKAVTIKPGAWFDSSLLGQMKNADKLLRPTVVYLAMFPCVTLTMDSSSYAAWKAAYTSSAGVGVGLWCGVSGSAAVQSSGQRSAATFNDASNTVTLRPSDTSPVVVAMQMAEING